MVKLSFKIILLLMISNQIGLSQIDLAKELKSGKIISLKPKLYIGVWSGDEQKSFFKINDLKTDKDGDIYVLDSGNYRIQKFNNRGDYIATIGHRGQGPGEFEKPISLFIDERNNLYVLDGGLLRITKFDAKGNYISSFRVSSQNPFDFVVDFNNYFVVLEADEGDILKKYEKNGEVIGSFCNLKQFVNLPKNGHASQSEIEKRFYNKLKAITLSKGALAIYRDIVFLTFKFSYKILMFNVNGVLLKEIKKNVTYPIKAPEIIAKEKENQGAFRIVTTKTSFGNSFGIDICVVRNVIFNLIASPKSPNGDEGEVIDVFDLGGKFLSQIKLSHFTRKIFIDEKLEIFCVVEGVDQFTQVPDEIPPSIIRYDISLINP